MTFAALFVSEKREKRKSFFMILIFQSSFRLSEKNEKDKKRKELTPVSATPTHMLRICVNPSFNTFRRLAATGATKCPDRPAIAEPRLQVRKAQAPTRIYCCAMSGYGEPRGSDFGACLGANMAR